MQDTKSLAMLLSMGAAAAMASMVTAAYMRRRHSPDHHHHHHHPHKPPPSDTTLQLIPAMRSRLDHSDPTPRAGYLSWDDYFMAIAFLSAQRSKDPNKQVGACIVSQDHVILGIGYNGFPRGCCDSKLPWAKVAESGDPLDTKYPYVCHAEMNALLNKNAASVDGAVCVCLGWCVHSCDQLHGRENHSNPHMVSTLFPPCTPSVCT